MDGFALKSERGAPRWAEWAERYGSSERTLKRWVSHGEDVGDECPLDEPAKLPGWWAKHMKQRVPRKVLAAADAAGPVAVSAEVEPVVREVRAAGAAEVGIQATLERLQNMELATHDEYLAAIRVGDDGKAKVALKSYTDLSAEVVKVREKALAHQERTRELVPRAEVEACIAEIHSDLLMRFRGIGEDVLRTFRVAGTAENLAVWAGLVDGLCVVLRNEVFVDE